jgi:Bacterial protein of unknown function (DUF916)
VSSGPSKDTHRRRRSIPSSVILTALLIIAGQGPAAGQAEEPPVALALRPIDQPGPFFDLTMTPGESRALEVEIANVGTAGLAARTYAADAYTIINGGFGVRLRDEPQSGTTLWLDYTTDTIQLPPGEGIRRTFTVTVPAGTPPGEYITSLVLENQDPLRGTGAVAIDQVFRQATAIVVTVPGARLGALEIGAARHTVVAGHSVVAVALENTGNVRLKPAASFAVKDAAGVEVWHTDVPMDSFFAGDATLVEVPIAGLLAPGAYTVALTLDDVAAGVHAADPAIPFTVEPPPATDPIAAIGQALTGVLEDARQGRVTLLVMLGALGVSLVTGVVLGSLIIRLRRRGRAGWSVSGG